MSHGPVDVFAAKNGNMLVIQVKSGSSRMKKKDVETFVRWAEAFNANGEIWYFKKRGKLQRLVVRSQPVVGALPSATSSIPQIPA